jgi:hypothetical protein
MMAQQVRTCPRLWPVFLVVWSDQMSHFVTVSSCVSSPLFVFELVLLLKDCKWDRSWHRRWGPGLDHSTAFLWGKFGFQVAVDVEYSSSTCCIGAEALDISLGVGRYCFSCG